MTSENTHRMASLYEAIARGNTVQYCNNKGKGTLPYVKEDGND